MNLCNIAVFVLHTAIALHKISIHDLYMTGNDHALEAADPLELAEIKRRWELYINQLSDYAYLCKDLLDGKM